jgi:Aspartyl protease
MVIVGEWRMCDDGVARPAVQGLVGGATGVQLAEYFLVDSCADRSVLSADLLNRLGVSTSAPPADLILRGIGGSSEFVLIEIALEFASQDGTQARVRGQFAAFTDPTATDLSILGRDVLNHFDVILSRRNNEVLLLAPNHRYRIEGE